MVFTSNSVYDSSMEEFQEEICVFDWHAIEMKKDPVFMFTKNLNLHPDGVMEKVPMHEIQYLISFDQIMGFCLSFFLCGYCSYFSFFPIHFLGWKKVGEKVVFALIGRQNRYRLSNFVAGLRTPIPQELWRKYFAQR